MKLPNNYGSIYKLSGKRRRPWRVRITTGWTVGDSGKPIQQRQTIGYYATRNEALQALADYQKNPFIAGQSLSFAEVYERWSDKKFSSGISASNIAGYKASFKLCADIYDVPFREIALDHLQHVIDTCGKEYPTRRKIVVLFNQLYDYAVGNRVVGKDKDVTEYINIGEPTKSELHYRFTADEIERIRSAAETDDYAALVLMLIYSGVRPGEMFDLSSADVHVGERYFYIRDGKNANAVRKVPIHESCVGYYERWLAHGTEHLITKRNGQPFNFRRDHKTYTAAYFVPLLSDLGILKYKNAHGDEREHRPDDTRHTFTTIWTEKRLSEAFRRKIQGHSGQGVGEQVYTHIDFSELLAELNKM